MRYIYSLVRFVPDPFRGEFVNVGAIVGSEGAGEWDVFQVSNLQRARALQDGRSSVLAVNDFIERHADLLAPFSPGADVSDDVGWAPSEEWLNHLTNSYRSVVQVSPPAAISATSLAEAFDVVGRFLVDPVRVSLAFQTRKSVRATARRRYVEAGLELNVNLFEGATLVARGSTERVDLAVVNGSALQVTQAWSFQLPRQDDLIERVKAWGWSFSRVRAGGAYLELPERRVDVPDDIEVAAVYLPPQDGDHRSLEVARSVFSGLDITGVPVDRVDEIAERGSELLAKASH